MLLRPHLLEHLLNNENNNLKSKQVQDYLLSQTDPSFKTKSQNIVSSQYEFSTSDYVDTFSSFFD